MIDTLEAAMLENTRLHTEIDHLRFVMRECADCLPENPDEALLMLRVALGTLREVP